MTDLAETRCGESSSAKTSYKHLILCCAHCWRWFRGVTSPEGRKNAISFLHHSSLKVAPMKILLYIIYVTLIPGYADVKAQWAYFKGTDSSRVSRFFTFSFLVILYLEISCSDITWWTSTQKLFFDQFWLHVRTLYPRYGNKCVFSPFFSTEWEIFTFFT